MPVKKLAVAPALLCFALSAFAADEAVSPPVGGVTVTLAPAVSGVPKITTFTPSMRMGVGTNFVGKSRGVLSQVTATTLTDSNAGWGVGSLSNSATPYYIKITSGAAAGSWWAVSTTTASTGSTVTVINRGINPVQAGITIGDGYEVVPVDTLKTLFGQVEGQIGGPNAQSADLVQIHDGISWREYHYNTTAGGWREGTSTRDRNNIVVGPDTGIVYFRRGGSPLNLVMLGNVSTSAEKLVVGSAGVTSIGNVFPAPSTRTLSSYGIQNSVGFLPNNGNLAAADKVRVFDGISWRVFNYQPSASQWREGTSTRDRNSFEIPAGAALIIERGSGSSSSYFITLTPTYTL